jgi:cobalt-precorrin-5B (C1)-methyltransferase
VDIVRKMAEDLNLKTPDLSSHTTTEGLFAALDDEQREHLGDAVGGAIARACMEKAADVVGISVVLVNMAGDIIGSHGDIRAWKIR